MYYTQLSDIFFLITFSSIFLWLSLFLLLLSLYSTLPLHPSIHPGALQIEMSEESDQGKYECVATNSDGTRYSTPANLYVRGKRGDKNQPVFREPQSN